MKHEEIKEKVMNILNGNYNLPLYSQKNRLYLASQISSHIMGEEIKDPKILIDGKKIMDENAPGLTMGGTLTKTKAPAQIEREKEALEKEIKSVKSKKEVVKEVVKEVEDKPVVNKKQRKAKEKQKRRSNFGSLAKKDK